MSEIIFGLAFMLSFLLALYGTPLARRVAMRYNILDIPDGRLKKQVQPVPYLGGMIVYFSFIAPISLMFPFNQQLLGILFASLILLIVGLFDDLKALTPGIKFLFQMVATYVLLKSGIFINLLYLPPWLNTVLSFLWILTAINAMNIIDIMDGLAVTVSIVALFPIFIIAYAVGNSLLAMLALCLLAALIGFWRFNWEPAQIYLGDSGSMVLGMIIGSLAIMSEYTVFNNWAFVSGFFLLAIPLFDLVYVMILRLIHGRSPFFGSPDHFALRLRKRLRLSARTTVGLIALLQVAIGLVAIGNYYGSPRFTLFSTLVMVIFFLVLGIWLALVKME